MSSSVIAKDESPMVVRQTAGWNGFRLVRWSALPGELTERSYADHEVNIPLAGNLTVTKHTAAGGRRLCHGDAESICLIPAGQPVAARWRDTAECVTIALKPALVTLAHSAGGPTARVELVETYDAKDHLIRQIGLALLAEASAREPAGRLYAESLAQTLALHLIRRYSVTNRAPEVFRGGLSGRNLRRATEFINEHLELDISLADVADSVGLSQYHFARAFKRTTNLTPQQYLTERRVERAKQLLAESDLPLGEVGARAGFKSQSHFTTLFRRFTHMTPKTWRKTALA